jgi:hypothetical protein
MVRDVMWISKQCDAEQSAVMLLHLMWRLSLYPKYIEENNDTYFFERHVLTSWSMIYAAQH